MKPISTAIVIALLVSSCSLFRKKQPVSNATNPELKELLKTAQKKLTMVTTDPSKVEHMEEAKSAADKAVKRLEGENSDVKYDAYFYQAEASRYLLKYYLDRHTAQSEMPDITDLSEYASTSYGSYVESLRQTEKKYSRLNSHKSVQSLQGELNRALVLASEMTRYSE